LSTIREKSFPSKEFLDEAREALMGAVLPLGCLSTAYLSSMARHAKHLLYAALRLACHGEIARCIAGMAAEPDSIVDAIAGELRNGVDDLPTEIARAASARLTRRVNDRSRGRGVPAGKHRLDALVDAILDGKCLDAWKRARRSWQESVVRELASRACNLDVLAITRGAVADLLSSMAVEDANIPEATCQRGGRPLSPTCLSRIDKP
jgi:hypothetical protein